MSSPVACAEIFLRGGGPVFRKNSKNYADLFFRSVNVIFQFQALRNTIRALFFRKFSAPLSGEPLEKFGNQN